VPKSGNVSDIVAALIQKAQLEDEATAGQICVFETHNNKIHRELSRENGLNTITDYIQLMAERAPKDDVETDTTLYIYAFHYHNDPSKSHGIPFKFRLIEVSIMFVCHVLFYSNCYQGEKFSETKKRLEKRTGIKGKNFEKIKFAVVKRSSYTKPMYLNDGLCQMPCSRKITNVPRRRDL
jgi:ubiquitin carboxyl-terminal hydrolase 7